MFRRFRSRTTLQEQPHHRPAERGLEAGSRWPKPNRWGPVENAIGTSRSGSRRAPAAPSSLGNIRRWRARTAAHSPFPLFARSPAPPMPAHQHATVTPRHCAHIHLNRAQPPCFTAASKCDRVAMMDVGCMKANTPVVLAIDADPREMAEPTAAPNADAAARICTLHPR